MDVLQREIPMEFQMTKNEVLLKLSKFELDRARGYYINFSAEEMDRLLEFIVTELGFIPNTFIESSTNGVYKHTELIEYCNIDGKFDYEDEKDGDQ